MLGPVADPYFNEEKLTELILYIANRTKDDPTAGATKLNKYLYFADFAAMRKLGHPITAADYQKLERGPAPRRLRPIRAKLLESGAARLEERSDAFGYVRHCLIPLRPARTELFTSDELALVDGVVDRLRTSSASEISELSHRDAGWQLVDEGDTIPYELAFVVAPLDAPPTEAVRAEGRRIAAEYADRLA
jgi:hypothetical protein